MRSTGGYAYHASFGKIVAGCTCNEGCMAQDGLYGNCALTFVNWHVSMRSNVEQEHLNTNWCGNRLLLSFRRSGNFSCKLLGRFHQVKGCIGQFSSCVFTV